MTHLSPEEFVDLLDGLLAPARAAHVEACVECRVQASAMRTALQDAASVEVPDPPAFFWDRFSARTRDAVAVASPNGWRERFGTAWIAAAATAVIVLAIFGGTRLARESRPPLRQASAPAAQAPRVAPATPSIDDILDSSNTEAWEVVVAAAADMQFDEARAAGMTPHAEAFDRAVQRMSDDELIALAQLLQSELKGAGD